jgi:hypothetical protein
MTAIHKLSCNRELVLTINRRPKPPIQERDDDVVIDDAGRYSFPSCLMNASGTWSGTHDELRDFKDAQGALRRGAKAV